MHYNSYHRIRYHRIFNNFFQVAATAVSYLSQSPAKELGVDTTVNISVTEIEEGNEPDNFFGG